MRKRVVVPDGALVLDTVRQLQADLLILGHHDARAPSPSTSTSSCSAFAYSARRMPEGHPPGAGSRRRWAELARVAAETAVAAGEAIAVENVDIVTRKRGRANFATAADHAAERFVLARLAKHDPSIPALAEESARDELRREERLWVVDPIDGTLNFSRALPFYCVVIGYVEGGRVRAGAIHAPRTAETFVAHEGGGALRNGLPIRVSRVAKASEAFAATSLAYGEASRQDSRFVAVNAHVARLRVIGSAALEIAYVAMGRLDLFVHGYLSPWDIAGPSIVAREAGATVVSLRTGEDAAWDEGQVIVGNPAVVKNALATMRLVKPGER